MPPSNAHASDQAQRERWALKRLGQFANTMDTRFQIPGTGIRLGWDAIIGLIPGIGDLAGLLVSAYPLVEALRLGTPKRLVARMFLNLAIEFVIGLVPLLGDLFDVYWKANLRNLQLLQRHLKIRLAPPAPPRRLPYLALALVLAISGALIWFLSSGTAAG